MIREVFETKIQQIRKINTYEMMDNIRIFYDGNDEIAKAVSSYEEYMKREILVLSIQRI